MRRWPRIRGFVYSVFTGAFAAFLFLLFYFAINRDTAPFMLILREVFPLYDEGVSSVINIYAYGGLNMEHKETPHEAEDAYNDFEIVSEVIPGDLKNEGQLVEPQIYNEAEMDKEWFSEAVAQGSDERIIGLGDVIFQPGTDILTNDNSQTELLTRAEAAGIDFDSLKSKLYTVDKRTELLETDIDIAGFLEKSFKIDQSEQGPKVLIFHTHSQEAYSNSTPGDLNDGILAVGDRLKELLETKYGIETLHDRSSYDIVDGESQILGAYERMEPSVKGILDKYPSIELVIDMHRDGVSEDIRFTAEINGKTTAKIMFFNGLCRVYQNGALTEISGLPNSFVSDNLALSLNLQLLANELFPDFTRKIYINAYRYSLHFKPKSLLVEVGAQTNTKEEALNAMEPLAEILAKTIK